MAAQRLYRGVIAGCEVIFLVIVFGFCSYSYGGRRLEMKDVFTREEQATLNNMPKEPGSVYKKRTRFLEEKLRRTTDPDHVLFLKLMLASEYPAIGEFKKAHSLLDEVKGAENAHDTIKGGVRFYEVRCYGIQALHSETEKDFLEFQKRADDLGRQYLAEFKEKGWDVEMYSDMLSRLHANTTALRAQCFSPTGRFLAYTERKRAQEETDNKNREKREQESKRTGLSGGGAPTSATLTKGGLRASGAASGGCGCGSDQLTSATKSAASCGGCGSGKASPKPASSPPGGGCGCGSAQPGKQSAASSGSCGGCGSGQPTAGAQPAAKPAGSSASSSGCGCGSPQPAAKPAESSAGGGGCGCGSAQPAANPAPPKEAAGQPAPRPGAIAQ